MSAEEHRDHLVVVDGLVFVIDMEQLWRHVYQCPRPRCKLCSHMLSRDSEVSQLDAIREAENVAGLDISVDKVVAVEVLQSS